MDGQFHGWMDDGRMGQRRNDQRRGCIGSIRQMDARVTDR